MRGCGHKFVLLGAILASLAPAAPAGAQSITVAAARSEEQRRFTKVGLVIGAAVTKEAVQRADDHTLALYRELETMRKRAIGAERAARAAQQDADGERRKSSKADRAADAAQARAATAEAEAVRLRGEALVREEALIEELARRDIEYAHAQKIFAEHMSDIVARDDPHITAALERYLDGDLTALDALSEYVDAAVAANRAADAAALAAIEARGRKRDGDLLRSVAAMWSDAADKGERSAAQALAKWQEAARTDPDNFGQWQAIYDLAVSLGLTDVRRQAVDRQWQLAKTPSQRALASANCAWVVEPRVTLCQGSWTGAEYEAETIRLRRQLVAQEPDNPAHLFLLVFDLQRQAIREAPDTPRRSALTAEAVAITEALRQRYPDNSAIEMLRISTLGNSATGLLPGMNLDSGRTAMERGVALSRDALERNPGSWAHMSRLATALENLSVITDADRDEARSIALADEAIAITEAGLAKDLGDLSRVSALWHAYTRAAMSARVFAAFERERGLYIKALNLGRPYVATDRDFMVELTLPRLEMAELAVGHVDTARTLSLEARALRLSRPPDAEQPADPVQPVSDAFAEARYAWIAGYYPLAAQLHRSLLTAIDTPGHFPGIGRADRLLFATIGTLSLALIEMERSRYDAMLTECDRALQRVDAAQTDPETRREAKVLRTITQLLCVAVPGSSVRWTDVTAPVFDGLDGGRFWGDTDLGAQMIARRRTLEAAEGPVTGTPRDQLLASLERTFRVADQLAMEGPPSEQRFSSALSAQKMRAQAGDPDMPWRTVADNYVHFYKLGWITNPTTVEDMHFALARAAAEQHPRAGGTEIASP